MFLHDLEVSVEMVPKTYFLVPSGLRCSPYLVGQNRSQLTWPYKQHVTPINNRFCPPLLQAGFHHLSTMAGLPPWSKK